MIDPMLPSPPSDQEAEDIATEEGIRHLRGSLYPGFDMSRRRFLMYDLEYAITEEQRAPTEELKQSWRRIIWALRSQLGMNQ